MADIELVIRIPDEEYQNYLKMRPAYPEGVFCYIKAIQNGTLLPKHHGRIIDESRITSVYYHEETYPSHYRTVIDRTNAPTIIEGSDNDEDNN